MVWIVGILEAFGLGHINGLLKWIMKENVGYIQLMYGPIFIERKSE